MRRTAVQHANSASNMWNAFDFTNMSILCGGHPEYMEANAVVMAFFKLFKAPVPDLPLEIGKPKFVNCCWTVVEWLASLSEAQFPKAVACVTN
jgi:hypothetical protein